MPTVAIQFLNNLRDNRTHGDITLSLYDLASEPTTLFASWVFRRDMLSFETYPLGEQAIIDFCRKHIPLTHETLKITAWLTNAEYHPLSMGWFLEALPTTIQVLDLGYGLISLEDVQSIPASVKKVCLKDLVLERKEDFLEEQREALSQYWIKLLQKIPKSVTEIDFGPSFLESGLIKYVPSHVVSITCAGKQIDKSLHRLGGVRLFEEAKVPIRNIENRYCTML